MARVQVLNDHGRGGEIRWQGGENVAQGRKPPAEAARAMTSKAACGKRMGGPWATTLRG